jgi:hypothetical protein
VSGCVSLLILFLFAVLGGNQSRHYDDKSPETFFDQCFNMEMKIGEGSFGEVGVIL